MFANALVGHVAKLVRHFDLPAFRRLSFTNVQRRAGNFASFKGIDQIALDDDPVTAICAGGRCIL